MSSIKQVRFHLGLGTTIQTTARLTDKHQESLLNDPKTCPREETVSALWERIQQHRVVHVRAPPASGKTTLSWLLHGYVREKAPDIPILWCSWPKHIHQDDGQGYQELLEHVLYTPQQLNWMQFRTLVIIDEAQNSYDCKSFWNDFIKVITPGTAPMVILFSAWASPTSRLSDVQLSTPVILTEEQRVSIRHSNNKSGLSAFFTHAEYLDVVERIKAHEGRSGQKFLPDSDVVDHVWDITSGHPAGVQATFNLLATSTVSTMCWDRLRISSLTDLAQELRHFREHSLPITFETAAPVLKNRLRKLVNHKELERSFSGLFSLKYNPKNAEVLRNALVNNYVEGVWEYKDGILCQTDEDVNRCYRNGWLHAELAPENKGDGEKTVYVFPTPLHRG